MTLSNHYTHEIIIFEIFRGLETQLSGVGRINLHYSYGFLVLLQNAVTVNHSPQEHSKVYCNQSCISVMISKRLVRSKPLTRAEVVL